MYTQAEIVTAFNEEAGDVASLTTTPEITRWFNDGQARLEWYRADSGTGVAWSVGQKLISLSSDIVHIEMIVYPDGVEPQDWQHFGDSLSLFDAEGATSAGNAELRAWVRWPDVTSVAPSFLPRTGDVACIYYALHRFFRKLGSNRTAYKKYATLMGANAVDMAELLAISQDYLEDFERTKEDLPNQYRGA